MGESKALKRLLGRYRTAADEKQQGGEKGEKPKAESRKPKEGRWLEARRLQWFNLKHFLPKKKGRPIRPALILNYAAQLISL
jgi:hypothetical protein